MDITDCSMQAYNQYFAETVHNEIDFLFPKSLYPGSSVRYNAGCNFAIINFVVTGVLRCVKYNRIHIYVDPFRPGNKATNDNWPFLPRVITSRLMLDDQFKNVEFSWAKFEDFEAGLVGFERKTRSCWRFCIVVQKLLNSVLVLLFINILKLRYFCLICYII